MNTTLENTNNPLQELISDEIYNLLESKNLINSKLVRDYVMRKKFKSMRAGKVSVSDAIDRLRDEYPYLQYDSIRKIIYSNKFND